MIAINGNAGPGNVHGSGIENRNGADGADRAQRFPALAGSLIVRSERSGNVRGRAGEIDDDFSFQVETGQLIEIFLRDLQAVADENQRRGELGRSAGGASIDESVVGERKRFGLAAGNESERGFRFINFVLIETDRLIEAVRAGRVEAGFLEFLDGGGFRFAKTLTPAVAAFEGIVGAKFDVRPPRVALEVGIRRSLLS